MGTLLFRRTALHRGLCMFRIHSSHRLLIGNSRIKECVQHICNEVHDHHQCRENDEASLSQRIVTPGDCLYDLPSESRPTEHYLNKHLSADGGADEQGTCSHNRKQGVSRCMMIQHRPITETFGMCHLDIVFAQHFEHAVTHDQHRCREKVESRCDRREYEVFQEVEIEKDLSERCPLISGGSHTLSRKPPQIYSKQQYHHESYPEGGS